MDSDQDPVEDRRKKYKPLFPHEEWIDTDRWDWNPELPNQKEPNVND